MTSTSVDVENKGKKRHVDRRKTYSGEKDAHIKPLLKLRQQESIIQKDLSAAIKSMKLESNLFQDIVQYMDEMIRSRDTFLADLHKNLHDIAAEFKSIKNTAEYPDQMEKLDAKTYKIKLLKFSQRLQDVKKIYSIESLAEESRALKYELDEFQTNIEKFNIVPKSVVFKNFKPDTVERKKHSDYSDAYDFHTLVAKTGHTGNWNEEDHLLFVNMRKKCNSIPALVASIQTKCPDLSVEAIVNHEAWYKVYLALREKQKSAVLKWKRQKEHEKGEKMQERKLDDLEEHLSRLEVITDNLDEGKLAIQKKTGKSRVKEPQTTNNVDSTRSKKKELIKQWKLDKENKRSMDEEQCKTQLAIRKMQKENRKQRRLQKLQKALNEYKMKKVETADKNSQEQSQKKYIFDTKLIKSFRKQDEEYIQRKKVLISRSKKPKRKEIKPKIIVFPRTRNSSTLFNATKIWTEKRRMITSTVKNPVEIKYIKDIPMLCTRWRNEESTDLRCNLNLN